MRLRKGFTLVELMIAVAILGVLAAIAVPMYTGYIRDSKKTEAKTNLETIRLLEEQYYADHGEYIAGSYNTNANPKTLQTNLKGFNPGSKLYFAYTVTVANTNQTFTATAANADIGTYTINHNNERTAPSGESW